jgi:hypothetical protein
MDSKRNLLAVFISAVLGTIMFHKQSLGLNVLVFEVATFVYLLATGQFSFKGKNQVTVGVALLVTAFATVFTHSKYSMWVNLLAFFAFIGVVIYPQAKSLTTALGLAGANVARAQQRFFNTLSDSRLSGKSLNARFRRMGIFLIPVVIIIVFVSIYRNSNPVFNNVMNSVWEFIDEYIFAIFDHIDVLLLTTFLFFIALSNLVYMRVALAKLVKRDEVASDELSRVRKKRLTLYADKRPKNTSLKNEYRAGVFLLITLNAFILLLNIIDIDTVWISFTWQGQYLKQFVHEGTYLLILSILISIGLVLYYFRGNLNFYAKNKTLKYLSYAWLAQNAVLVLSVGMRNYRYIQHFSLAYKRIGVIIFLVLTLYGLYTVFIKVKHRRSSFYLFRANTYAALVVLVATSFVNWDNVIARYNFSHSNQSFLHLNFMCRLGDTALPILNKPAAEMEAIEKVQREKFFFEDDYMDAAGYNFFIARRVTTFKYEWEHKSIWEWNWAEYNAYKEMKNE